MLFAELAMRTVVATELALLCAVLLRADKRNPVYLSSAALLLCILGYQMAPVLLHHTPWKQSAYPFIALAVLVPAAFWRLSCTIFRDDFRAPGYVYILAILTAALGLLGFSTGPRDQMDWIDWMSQTVKLVWVLAAFLVTLRDWRVDLVEHRRRFRSLVVLGGGIYISVIMVVELFITGQAPAAMELLNVSLIFLLVTGLTLNFLTIDRDNVFARMAAPDAEPQATCSPLAGKVIESMERDRTYATEGLTLQQLARQLQSQPHQLRRVINGELGYRNFNTFINLYRVKEVAERLAMVEYQDTPFLTLALDAGFRSLAPFNRTFRDHFEMTPSEYRASLTEHNPLKMNGESR
jgi:AraC-like DNA-binding protein